MATAFFKDLTERVIRTFVQAFLATVTAGATGVIDVSSLRALSVAAFSAAVAAIMGLLTAGIGPKGTPSVIDGAPEVTPVAIGGTLDDGTPMPTD